MLPSNLLAVWKRQGKIYPRYIKKTKNNVEIALNLIEVYQNSIGKKKKSIKNRINEFEEHNYRFIRGLSILLDRRSTYKCNSEVDPKKLRNEVFGLTGTFGPATTFKKRNQILEEISKKLELPIDKIVNNIYADLDNELILTSFKVLTPEELLEFYNLSLTQTLLFDSTEIRFTTSHNWQKIFFIAKKLGLIYEATKNGELWIKINGPISIFKLNRRYGSNISKLIPSILKSSNWKIEAKILWKHTNEIYSFRIDSANHQDLFKIQEETVGYDSLVEENFGSRFQALKTKWVMVREPEPLIVDKHVMIPDFSFERDGVKVYMEVVGFWTTDYLLRKIEKLKKIKVKMLAAVDQNLACGAMNQLKKHTYINILYYKKRIPLAPVLSFLKNSYKETYDKQIDFLKNLTVNFTEPMIYFEEFATRIGVSAEAAREVIMLNPPEDYVIWPKGLIRKEKAEKIKQQIDKKMKDKQKIPLTIVITLLNKEGIDATSIIRSIGYKIIWRGLTFEKAEVVKI